MVSELVSTGHTMQIGKVGFQLGRKLFDSTDTLKKIVTKMS